MPTTRHVSVKDGDVLLLAGTTKGAFLLRSDAARKRWDVGGPYFPGQSIYTLALDQRNGRRRLWAGGGSDHWGPVLHSSDDFGKNWTNPERASVKFPDGVDSAVKQRDLDRPGGERRLEGTVSRVDSHSLGKFASHGTN